MANNINQLQTQWMQDYGNKMKYFWDYYRGDKSVIPVFKRVPASDLKAKTHTNTHVDFFGDIIDLKQGYMGENIEIDYLGEDTKIEDKLREFTINTHFSTENSQTVEYSSAVGLSHRLCYTKDGQFRTKNLHGWQVVYEYDNDIFDPDKAYYFYAIQELGDTEATNYCNVYDKKTVKYFRQEKQEKKGLAVSQKNTEAVYVLQDEQPHLFNQVPISPFLNTSNFESNCYQSTDLMDIYDEIISDTAGELKAARLAYLKIYGTLYTGQDAAGNPIPVPDYLREFGTMLFGQTQEGKPLGDAEFLEKKIDDTAIENMLNRLRGHIYEVSGSIDLKELSAAERVFSIKASMMRLENNAKTSENYLKLGLRKVLQLWLYWLKEYNGLSADIVDFNINVGRVFPFDEQAAADILLKLSGVLNIEDALRLSGYDDVKSIAERAQELILPPLGDIESE